MNSSRTPTAMSNRFRTKLKQIRDASKQRSDISHRVRAEADIHRSQATVASFEYRERLEAVIEEFVDNFLTEAPGFVLNRGFFEGKYMLAMRLDEQLIDNDGEVDQYFSRLMFLLAPHSEEAEFAMQCRKTIRNRDVETTNQSAPMDSAGTKILSSFIEEQFVAFAEAYFGESHLSRPAGVPH
jgi:hypothetical protein